ncbi:hypothetical protein HK105_205195 [Polyrhizophydium stewartii]|uniref:Phospholipid scramblase n=1 Tax=Polyrhizophydium stewartii TaxID=2732419 RepID=A0ABR4N762_9FUNG|nr:hypothetical protein HK105_001691 [Polyrhizophydium stewartii]
MLSSPAPSEPPPSYDSIYGHGESAQVAQAIRESLAQPAQPAPALAPPPAGVANNVVLAAVAATSATAGRGAAPGPGAVRQAALAAATSPVAAAAERPARPPPIEEQPGLFLRCIEIVPEADMQFVVDCSDPTRISIISRDSRHIFLMTVFEHGAVTHMQLGTTTPSGTVAQLYGIRTEYPHKIRFTDLRNNADSFVVARESSRSMFPKASGPLKHRFAAQGQSFEWTPTSAGFWLGIADPPPQPGRPQRLRDRDWDESQRLAVYRPGDPPLAQRDRVLHIKAPLANLRDVVIGTVIALDLVSHPFYR